MAYRNRDVEEILLNKFKFVPSKTHAADHRWFELTLPDLPVITTHFSHTKEDIASGVTQNRPYVVTSKPANENSR